MAAEEPFDWADAGAKFSDIQNRLMHSEGTSLHGAEFYGEALRRWWERFGHNWVPQAEMMRALEINHSVDRANGERAEATLKHFTEEYQRKLADARTEMAKAIRARCNEVTVPSRYRREGVLLAADWLDGGKGA